jgi:hypothetical protein
MPAIYQTSPASIVVFAYDNLRGSWQLVVLAGGMNHSLILHCHAAGHAAT